MVLESLQMLNLTSTKVTDTGLKELAVAHEAPIYLTRKIAKTD